MTKKFIPNGDLDFATMAETFARQIAANPARYEISPDASDALTSIVVQFREALSVARAGGARSQMATAAKEEARSKAEMTIRRMANRIRNNESIDPVAKLAVGLRERTAKPKVLTVPNESPRLVFVRAIHDAVLCPQHELKFSSLDHKPKPPGAVRLELFVDLVPPDEPVPEFPGQRKGSRPVYVRSFTRSPFRITPPMAKMPMRVVYWGRWADSAGNVGPLSATATGWIEGGSHHLMGPQVHNSLHPRPTMLPVPQDMASTEQETTIVVALMETLHAVTRNHQPPQLTMMTSGTARQLEGPKKVDAA